MTNSTLDRETIAKQWLIRYNFSKLILNASYYSESDYQKAEDKLFELCRYDPDEAWEVITIIVAQTSDEFVHAVIASAPLGVLIETHPNFVKKMMQMKEIENSPIGELIIEYYTGTF